jgi:hypothetical protein
LLWVRPPAHQTLCVNVVVFGVYITFFLGVFVDFACSRPNDDSALEVFEFMETEFILHRSIEGLGFQVFKQNLHRICHFEVPSEFVLS